MLDMVAVREWASPNHNQLGQALDIKANMHNIAVFDGIFLTFQA